MKEFYRIYRKWFDDDLNLKEEAPEEIKKAYKKLKDEYEKKRAKGIFVD